MPRLPLCGAGTRRNLAVTIRISWLLSWSRAVSNVTTPRFRATVRRGQVLASPRRRRRNGAQQLCRASRCQRSTLRTSGPSPQETRALSRLTSATESRLCGRSPSDRKPDRLCATSSATYRARMLERVVGHHPRLSRGARDLPALGAASCPARGSRTSTQSRRLSQPPRRTSQRPQRHKIKHPYRQLD
jgi:hypothetical protein